MSRSASAFAAGHYRNVALEGRIGSADPHGLILMLFDGAIERVGLARSALAGNDNLRKVGAVTAAVNIVHGLRQSLDRAAGGALADRLDQLYDYVERRLVQANLQNDAAALDEAAALLADLRSAWASMPGAAR